MYENYCKQNKEIYNLINCEFKKVCQLFMKILNILCIC